MPRDPNGNYTLPAGNPVVTDTLIASTWSNNTMGDLANEMQDSLSRSGKGGFTAPVGIVDKSGSVPGLNFVAEPTSGLKREGTEDVRMQVTTTDVWQGIKTGVKVLTPASGGVLKHPVVEESGQKVMRGESGVTASFFYNDTAPPGWTLLEPDANIRELVIGPSGTGQGGTFAGTLDPTDMSQAVNTTVTITTAAAVTEGHALTVEEMPSHGHPGSTAPQSADTGGADGTARAARNAVLNGTVNVASQGGGATHAHDIAALSGSGTGTGNVTITPRYARGILATLD